MPIKKDPTSIRLPHGVIVKSPGLLPMRYTVSELADDLGLAPWRIREWIQRGAPAAREDGHVWLIGTEFAAWVERCRQSRRVPRARMADDEAWCLRCRAVVRMEHVTVSGRGRRWYLAATCPTCSGKLSKRLKESQWSTATTTAP